MLDVARGIRAADVVDRSAARIHMYARLNTIEIATDNKTVSEIADEVMALS